MLTNPHNRKILVLFSFVLLIFLGGCISETEQYIQGYWQQGNVHFADTWYFERGNFSHQTQYLINTANTTTGRYQVLDSQEDSIILELYDIDLAFGDERNQIEIKLDPQKDTIRIRNQVYERFLP